MSDFPQDMSKVLRVLTVDYHERNNWAVAWLLLNENDECFAYREFNPSPMKVTTEEIAEQIAERSNMEHYRFCLIDPLAKKNQPNTGKTALEVLNKKFRDLAGKGKCGRIHFEAFDTKGTLGRDVIRNRLRGAYISKKPGNNYITEAGQVVRLPTLWISRECRMIATSLRKWRYEENTGANITFKDKKEITIQRYSHFCTAIEGVMKDKRFKVALKRSGYKPPSYFKREGR